MNRAASLLAITLAVTACGGDLDPPWQLDHDRIIAIRATPAGLASGERAELDALLAVAGGPTLETSPEEVRVISPARFAGTVAVEDGRWFATAPDEGELDAARSELGLEPGEPVPLQLGVAFAGQTLLGLKTIALGEHRDNPVLAPMMIDGAAAPEPGPDVELEIGSLVDVPLSIDVAETDEVNWLTSCGTMHDFDLPRAYVRVEEDDPTEGELAVVVRDELGGVDWEVWKIHALPAATE